MKLKKLIQESVWGKRAFGDKLPTMDDYKKEHELGKVYTDKDKPPFKTEAQINEAIDLKDAGGEIFDTIIAFKKIYEKSPHKKNRKINMYIKQLLKIEQQISDVISDLD